MHGRILGGLKIPTNFSGVTLKVTEGVRRGVSKGVEDGHRPPALRAAISEMAVRPFQGWPPAGCRGVEHGRL